MLFIVRFLDHPDRLEVRKKFLAEHFDWLDAHQSTVLVAGSAAIFGIRVARASRAADADARPPSTPPPRGGPAA